MKKILYLCFFAFVFSACQNNSKQSVNIVTPTPNGVPSAQAAPSAPVQQAASTGEKPVNNPPHGQPYHNCAIPVGSPLSAKNTTVPAVQAPAAPAQQQVPATNKEVKLNPPHGQPGHDCKVSVGAPLT